MHFSYLRYDCVSWLRLPSTCSLHTSSSLAVSCHQNASEVKHEEQVSSDLSCDIVVASRALGERDVEGLAPSGKLHEVPMCKLVLCSHAIPCFYGVYFLSLPDCPAWRWIFTSDSINRQLLLSKFHTCRSTSQNVLAQQPKWTWTLSHHHSKSKAQPFDWHERDARENK